MGGFDPGHWWLRILLRQGIGMEGFGDHHSTCPQSQQHPDHVSDSAEDPISDEVTASSTDAELYYRLRFFL